VNIGRQVEVQVVLQLDLMLRIVPWTTRGWFHKQF
jgi:hypothetical protein